MNLSATARSDRAPVILVTGGSRGIGRAIATRAAHAGYDVAISFAEDMTSANEVLSEIKKIGTRYYARQSDLSGSADEIQELLDDTESALGPITHLVNNVGITGRIGKLVDLPEDVLRKTVNVNVIGTILTCQHVVTRWIKNDVRGSIVNISSIAATLGAPGEYVHYAC